jgi:hypothetical protein
VQLRRLLVPVATAVALVALLASPASATPILADDDFKWFYWVGPLLVLSLIGLLLLIAVGYYLRVLRPKWRGRPSS